MGRARWLTPCGATPRSSARWAGSTGSRSVTGSPSGSSLRTVEYDHRRIDPGRGASALWHAHEHERYSAGAYRAVADRTDRCHSRGDLLRLGRLRVRRACLLAVGRLRPRLAGDGRLLVQPTDPAPLPGDPRGDALGSLRVRLFDFDRAGHLGARRARSPCSSSSRPTSQPRSRSATSTSSWRLSRCSGCAGRGSGRSCS